MSTPTIPVQSIDSYWQRKKQQEQTDALRTSVSFAATQNPDEYAKVLRQAAVTGVAPELAKQFQPEVQHAATMQNFDFDHFVGVAPKLSQWAANPDNAAVSVDDLHTLLEIEANTKGLGNLTPGQRQAVIEERKRVGLWNKERYEITSGVANVNTGFYSPFVNFGANVGALLSNLSGSFKEGMDILTGIHGTDAGLANLKRIWTQDETQGAQTALRAGEAVNQYLAGPQKQAPQQYLIDPMTGGKFENPDYKWYGRNLVNSLEGVPGAIAGFMVGGEVAGPKAMPTVMATNATAEKYRQAIREGADIPTALNEGLGSGLLNYALMTKVPGAVPAETIKGTVAQAIGRGTALGAAMTYGENLLARQHDPNRPLFEGALPNIMSMIAFEGAGSMNRIIDLAAQSKLKARDAAAFRGSLEKIFEGEDAIRIPRERFEIYFQSKGMNPEEVAQQIGVKNYVESQAAGSDVDIPKADFLTNLDVEHQKGLVADIIDPKLGMSVNQIVEAQKAVDEFMANGGAVRLQEAVQNVDRETEASPEYQSIREQLHQQYVSAGETEAKANYYATLQANVYTNLARETGLTPTELLTLYTPRVVLGEAPTGYSDTTLPPLERDGRVSVAGTPIAPRQAADATVQQLKVAEVALDPKRFQYKLNTDESGVTNLLKGRTWNEDLAGLISVWRDPSNGKVYVVNGHHRFQLAKENKVSHVWTRVINAETAEEARSIGALQNIAEGRGTPMDAAKFFRDSGITPEKLDSLGISMGEATAAKGVALARLDPYIFDQVVSGKIREGRGIAIGNATNNPADQEAILKLINKAEKKGKRVTDDVVDELARMVKSAGQHTEQQEGLFGVQELTRNLALEKADISAAVRARIATEKRIFQSVSQEAKAKELGKVEGQSINAAKNAEIAQQAAQAQEIYDLLSTRSGPIDDILNAAAKELATGGNANAIKQRAYDAIRAELSQALTRSAESRPDGVSEAAQSSEADGTAALFQARRRVNPEDSLSLPGMESADAERASASATAEGERLTSELQRPLGSTDKAAGEMERNSPLFSGTGDNPLLFQASAASPRGWFRVLPDGTLEIGKTKIGDLSTFIHEPAHGYLYMLSELVKREGASETLRSDYSKILDFLGAKQGEALTTEQHEKWARANELYLREGKAPSQSLKGVFHRFAVWLTSIYKRADQLGVELNDDIRGVFDRMYAAEEGVNRAESEAGPKLFSTPEEAGWTPEQFQAYAEARNVSIEQAKEEILAKLNEAAIRERSDSWREEERNTREAVTAEIDARPEYTAIRSLRKGALDDGTPLTMSREELVKLFGEERVKQLQKLHPNLYRNEGGVHPEVAAEMLGFGSADEMLRTLEAVPRRSLAIDKATRDYMTAKHGDIRYDGTLDDQARLAVENDKKADALHSELNALAKRLAETKQAAAEQKAAARNIVIPPIEAFRRAAEGIVASKSLRELTPTRYLDASRKFSREAFDALRRGDVEAAKEAKQKELINHFLFREATKAREFGDRVEKLRDTLASPKRQSALGKAGQDFLDQVQKLMLKYRMTDGFKAVPVGEPESLAAFLERMKEEQDRDIPIPQSVIDSAGGDYRSLPMVQLHEVYDALKTLDHVARTINKITIDGKKMDEALVANGLDQSLVDNVKRGERERGKRETDDARNLLTRVKDSLGRLPVSVLRPEFLFKRLDGLKDFGKWHDAFWNKYNDAADHLNRLRESIFPQMIELARGKWAHGLDQRIYIESLGATITKNDAFAMLLNSGNESNLDKLERGGIRFKADDQARVLTEDVRREIFSHLTAEDIDKANQVLRLISTLKPEVERLSLKRNGVAPQWIETKPYQLPNGTLEGGYFPLVYDPRWSAAGEKQSDTNTVDQMFNRYATATTRQGYTKERTGFAAPLSLDWQAVVMRHLDNVMLDISHWEFVTEAQRLLKNPVVKESIITNLGEAYHKNLMDWVRYTVNQDAMGREATDGIDRFRRTVRGNIGTAVLGFRVMNSVVETAITPMLAFQQAAPTSVFKGMMAFMRNPMEAMRFAADASDYMKNLDVEYDRQITEMFNDLRGDHSLMGDIKKWAILSRTSIWRIGTTMAWHIGFLDAQRQGLDGKAAIRVADALNRKIQEAGRPGDLSASERNPYMKELTMFVGPTLIQFNNYMEAAHAIGDRGFNAQTAGKALTVLLAGHLVNSVLFELMRRKGPEDDKKWPAWLIARMSLGLFDGVPVLNQATQYAEGKIAGEAGKEPRLVPVLQLGKDSVDSAQQLLKASHTGEWSRALKTTGRAVGEATGLPATQGTITGQYLYDLLTGEYKPEHPWSYVTDAAYARKKKR